MLGGEGTKVEPNPIAWAGKKAQMVVEREETRLGSSEGEQTKTLKKPGGNKQHCQEQTKCQKKNHSGRERRQPKKRAEEKGERKRRGEGGDRRRVCNHMGRKRRGGGSEGFCFRNHFPLLKKEGRVKHFMETPRKRVNQLGGPRKKSSN